MVSEARVELESSVNYGPKHFLPDFNQLDSNARFDTVKSDSIIHHINRHLIAVDSLRHEVFTSKKMDNRQWKLLSVRNFELNMPCCRPSYQIHNIFYFESENLEFSTKTLHTVFEADSRSWHMVKRGHKYLTVTCGYRYIMNDSAEGGTIYIFELNDD